MWRGRLWAVAPMTVVEDGDDRVVLWRPKGTMRKIPTSPPTRPLLQDRPAHLSTMMANCDWIYGDHEWDVDTLWLLTPGAWSSVWVSWLSPGVHWGWYINLQEPFRRSGRGFVTMDLMLDVVVETDRSWQWKDEDDFQAMIDRDLIEAATVTRVRAEAQRVIDDLEADRAPFNEGWERWRPDPGWSRPVLPDDWAVLTVPDAHG